jgi:superfamily II DNA/RNA helicase
LLIIDQTISELRLTAELQRFQWNAISWSDVCQGIRRRNIKPLKHNSSFPILVCKTGNCRGMDDIDISHVVITCPIESPSAYQHMAGRTARQGQEGTVMSFIPAAQAQELIHHLKLKKVKRNTFVSCLT